MAQVIKQNIINARLILVVFLFCLCVYPNEVGTVTIGSLEDAYLGVSVFVTLTLLAFYGAEFYFKMDLKKFMKDKKALQVPICSFLGALPGCGGAVVVITAYNSGSVTMGAVVAALTSTMGDAAFLLIAKRPDAALFLIPFCWLVGTGFGYMVNIFYHSKLPTLNEGYVSIKRIENFSLKYKAYLVLFLPGVIFGIIRLSFLELPASLNTLSSLTAQLGIFMGLFIWAFSPVAYITHPEDKAPIRAVEETCFISIWVIIAFLTFEYTVYFSGINLESVFNSVSWLLPMLAIFIGLIPGCGPQILVTTLYINGIIPFSSLLGNAISNDGDALFPAIAISPKAAITATLLSTIPALFVSYSFYFLAPSFLS